MRVKSFYPGQATGSNVPEQWLTTKRKGGSLSPDRWLKTIRIIHLAANSDGYYTIDNDMELAEYHNNLSMRAKEILERRDQIDLFYKEQKEKQKKEKREE